MKIGKNFKCLGTIEPFNRHFVEIGDNVLLGGQSKIVLHGPIRPYRENNKIILEDLVWVGFRCLILPGTKIGRASLVGLNSVVVNDHPPYSIIAGSPAKAIKKREIGEILNFYVIRILMDGTLGVTKAKWPLLTMDHIKYALGHKTATPYDENLDLDNMTVKEILEKYATKYMEL